MSKKLICTFMAITVIALSLFAACADKDIYVDPAGETHIAVTDSEGNTVVNDDGNVIVYQTEKDGSIVTNASGEKETLGSVFPELIQKGNTVQTKTYDIELPSGWEADENIFGTYHKSSDTKIEIDIHDVTPYNNFVVNTRATYANLEKRVKDEQPDIKLDSGEEEITYNSAGGIVNLYHFFIEDKDGNNGTYIYYMYFMKNNNIYSIRFTTTDKNYDKNSFFEFCDSITFKPYAYYSDSELEVVTTTGKAQ